MVQGFLTYGTPEQVRQQIEDFADAGLDGLIYSFDPRQELEAVTKFGTDVISAF
jgi:alkanesulfonate monooxygenase SsuD/methylene tetrahydromethanopterin reductase-like flavin-dependent oxidoreductase (luciferase family)